MLNTSNPQPWWSSTDKSLGMKNRVEAIHAMRDPGTFADEVLKGGKFLFWLSLLFTGTLCFFSYQFFLERFLSPEFSILAAVAVTVLIEYGKQRIGMAAVRLPFLQGVRWIGQSPENTFMFLGATVFAVVIFSISVYNSTNGAARYAQQTAEQKTEKQFVANTAAIDSQIVATQATITNAPTVKWKGKIYYQDAKSVRAAQETVKQLQAERAEAKKTQREDFVRSRDKSDAANTHSAGIALRIGGWLELVQVILMLLMASCERVLDRRNPTGKVCPTPQPQQQQPVGFRQQPAVSNQTPQNIAEPAENYPERQPIGFHRYSAQTAQSKSPVPQTAQSVQVNERLLCGEEADKAIRAHLSLLKKEPSNYTNRYANPETVSKRIHGKLDSLTNTMKWVEWCSESVALEVVNYINNSIWPHLVQHGYAYDLKELYSLFNQKGTGGSNYA